jgi:hypothetical protein
MDYVDYDADIKFLSVVVEEMLVPMSLGASHLW